MKRKPAKKPDIEKVHQNIHAAKDPIQKKHWENILKKLSGRK